MTTDMGAVLSAVQQYGDDRVVEETADLTQQLVNANNDLTRVKADLEVSSTSLTNANVEISSLRTTIVGLTTTVDVLTARIHALEAQLSPWEPLFDLDLSVNDGWTARNETQTNDNSRNLPSMVSFGDRGLVITGRRAVSVDKVNRPFVTGDITGYHHPLPNYFRLRVRASAPHSKGWWPCPMWLRSLRPNTDGEIDLMENFGMQPNAKATLHSAYNTATAPNQHKMIGDSLPWSALDGAPDGMHTYVIEKVPNAITIWADDEVLLVAGPSTNPSFPWAEIFEVPEKEWGMRATLQAECGTANPGCATGSVPSTFTGSVEMVIESIEAWSLRQDAS